MGKALYRKYRPTKLGDVVGQEGVVQALSTALKQGKISHAYLFTGARGTGKTTIARIFAHEINGFKYELEDDYVDIIEIDAASNRGIDDIRELREKAAVAPTIGKYKVYILDECHMLTKEASNALLKVLEEPPEHVVFMMATTNIEKVLPTIISRSQVYNFSLAEAGVMQEYLAKIAKKEKIKITDGALEIIVRKGGGSFRDSLSLLDQLSTLSDGEISAEDVEKAMGLPREEILDRLLAAYAEGDIVEITTVLKETLNSGAMATVLAEELAERIIAKPAAELLPLLDKLSDVAKPLEPFPEARLLLALTSKTVESTTVSVGNSSAATSAREPSVSASTSAGATSPAFAAVSPAKARTDVSTTEAPATTSAHGPSGLPVSVRNVIHRTAEETASDEANSSVSSGIYVAALAGENAPEGSRPDAAGAFDWAKLLESVQQNSYLLHNILSSSKHQVENDVLVLYVKNPGIVNAVRNKELLQKLSGMAVEGRGLGEAAGENFGRISDIMGNVEEVKDAGNPFE